MRIETVSKFIWWCRYFGLSDEEIKFKWEDLKAFHKLNKESGLI